MKFSYNLLFIAIGFTLKKCLAPPNVLHLRIVQRCNFTCKYCFTRIYTNIQIQNNQRPDILPQYVHTLLKDARTFGCREVDFGGLGEPTLHPNFYQFLCWAKDITYSIAFTSNGWTLDPKKITILDKRDVIRISIDNMHLDGSPNPQKYIDQMKNLIFENKKKKYKMITVSHGEVNSEIESMLAEHGIAVKKYHLLKEAISKPKSNKRAPIIPCIYPWYSISIDSDLNVYPCPCAFGSTIGQISEQISLSEIWYGKNMQNFRQNMYSENPPEQCKTCDKWNRGLREWMNALLMAL